MPKEIEIQQRSETKLRSTGVIWGPTKVGKTTFLASLPRPIVFVMLDPDGGNVLPTEDIYIIDLSDMSNSDIIAACKRVIPRKIEDDIPENTASVVVDSLTVLANAALMDAIEKKVGASKDFTPSLEAPGLGAYGARTNNTTDAIRNILRATKRRGLHCWFTAHQDEPTLDAKGVPLYTSMTLSGKATNQLGLQVSEIWHLRDDGADRYISIRNCRGRQPMGSRMFKGSSVPEFKLSYDPEGPLDQPHALSTWISQWQTNSGQAIPIPPASKK